MVHGIPGANVKVCVDGAPAIRKFTYGEKAVRRALPAGEHNVRIVPTGQDCASPAILQVPAGDHRVKVALPGSKTPVSGPRRLTLQDGQAYQVHAIGKPGEDRLAVVQTSVGTH